MKNITFTISMLIALFWGASAAYASEGGSCHFHGNKPAAEATVTGCALQRKTSLISSGKLDASWKLVTQSKAELINGKKAKEWQVTFSNPSAKDKTKQTMYMFFTQQGNFIAANFTGQ